MESPLAEAVSKRAATLAAAARRLNSAAGVSAPFFLAFLTDRARIRDPIPIAAALPAGAALVLRDYDMSERGVLARALRRVCADRGVLFLVGGDEALAREIRADGVHLRSDQLAVERPGFPIVSASCHSANELERAATLGADLVFLAPAFATASHPGASTLGTTAFKALAENAPLPVLALGGVNERNALALAGPNVAGFAAIGAFAPLAKS
ncbi:MAG TPA: thiamine phosphate synthase [Parvularculaceae bacterium]|nr:thiamine phosphate synthase [Parvularculaceae bacterium]